MRKSLFIVYYDLDIGGIQKRIVDVANKVFSLDPTLPVYILLRHKKDFILAKEIENPKVVVFYYSSWLKAKSLLFFPVFVLYHIWKLRPKAILSFSDVPNLSVVLARLLFFWRKFKVVIGENPNQKPSETISQENFAFLRHLMVRFFYPFADTIFAASKLFCLDLIETYNLPKKKVKIIPNWTVLSNRKITRKKKDYDLIFVGRLIRAKRVFFLLRAVKEIKKKCSNISLCVVGDGEERSVLEKSVKEFGLNDNVFFAGKVGRDKVADYLSRARILVIPSATEGLPGVALEAMALGVPVISSNYPGVSELIEEDKTGFIFKSKKDLIKKIFCLTSESKKGKQVVYRAKKMVRQNYSSENINIYLKALGLI